MDRPKNPYLAATYCGINILACAAIVFANKAVFTTFQFHFVTALTAIHVVFTYLGMLLFLSLGFYTDKQLAISDVAPLAFSYVGYVVLSNMSLKLNPIGFYQIMKIACAPTVLLLEYVLYNKQQTRYVTLSVLVVCVGVTFATVADTVAISNMVGVVVAVMSTLVTAMYLIWVGQKQRELEANSSQLLKAYTPQAFGILLALIPIIENVGFSNPASNTLLGYRYTLGAVGAILLSSLLGVLVTFSTFLVIGATDSLTYNIVGHLKTVFVLAGGVMLFNDSMSAKKLLGLLLTAAGISWYTYLTFAPAKATTATPVVSDSEPSKAVSDAAEVQPLLSQKPEGTTESKS